jgi:hypothetical protein
MADMSTDIEALKKQIANVAGTSMGMPVPLNWSAQSQGLTPGEGGDAALVHGGAVSGRQGHRNPVLVKEGEVDSAMQPDRVAMGFGPMERRPPLVPSECVCVCRGGVADGS